MADDDLEEIDLNPSREGSHPGRVRSGIRQWSRRSRTRLESMWAGHRSHKPKAVSLAKKS